MYVDGNVPDSVTPLLRTRQAAQLQEGTKVAGLVSVIQFGIQRNCIILAQFGFLFAMEDVNCS